jgi:hypothetical protein
MAALFCTSAVNADGSVTSHSPAVLALKPMISAFLRYVYVQMGECVVVKIASAKLRGL